MKLILSFISLVFVHSYSMAISCDVFQTKDISGNQRLFGNAVPLTNHVFVMNEHSLYPGTQTLKIRSFQKEFQAQVLFRDFHTDLAFIKVENQNFIACSPPPSEASLGQRLALKGYQIDETAPFSLQTNVKSNFSQRGSVAGVRSMIEIQFATSDLIEQSMSGSALFDENELFYGLLSQRTWNGTGLAIKYDFIREIYARGPIQRRYRLSSDRKYAYYAGLEINLTAKVQIENHAVGNPHEGRLAGNPHEGRRLGPLADEGNVFVSGSSSEMGFVLVKVVDLKSLQLQIPSMAKFVQAGDYIEILKINGIPVRSSKDLLKIIEDSSEIKVEEYIIRKLSQNAGSVVTAQGLDNFFLLLEAEHGGELVKRLDALKPRLLMTLQRCTENHSLGKRDVHQLAELSRVWFEIRKIIDVQFHSEDLIQEIFKIDDLILMLNM